MGDSVILNEAVVVLSIEVQQYVNTVFHCCSILRSFPLLYFPDLRKMATDIPPVFEDLGKSARDVFNKGFGERKWEEGWVRTRIVKHRGSVAWLPLDVASYQICPFVI